jgi:YgiT-type zinc finger domain-containing protein
MKCVVCKQGETADGLATVTLVRGDTTLVMKGVPAQVCSNCGEEYVADDVTARVLEAANAAATSGVEVDVRRYVA